MTGEYKFYDRIAKEYGIYDTPCPYIIKEYPGENPEDIFKRKILEIGGKNKIALDLGCGDGQFTLSIANYFKKIFAVDLSSGFLAAANRLQREKRINNVSFEIQNAFNTTYKDNIFDLVYSRRGPMPYVEIWRLLRPNGFFLGIRIAELDCKELKVIFGRGQNCGKWNIKSKEKDVGEFKKLSFKVLFAEDYVFTEYYPSYNKLDAFLKRVPIFEDFDSEKDKEKLSEYVRRNTTEKGIKLPRHKMVIIVQKIK